MKMNRLMIAALLLEVTVSQATVVGFGERYVGVNGTFTDNPTIDFAAEWRDAADLGTSADLGTTYARSVIDTDNDITFTLTLSSSGNHIGYRNTAEDIGLLNDGNGYDNNNDSTIEAGEGTLTMTLALTGTGVANLTSLNLERIYVRRWGGGEGASFGDGGTNTLTTLTGDYTDYLDYTGTVDADQSLAGLTALTKDNTGLWQLDLSATGTQSIGLGAIGFEYTVVPEPATLGLLAFVGGGMLWIRRTFTI